MVPENLDPAQKKTKGELEFLAPANAFAEVRIVASTTIKKIEGRLEDEGFLAVGERVFRGYCNDSNMESIIRVIQWNGLSTSSIRVAGVVSYGK